MTGLTAQGFANAGASCRRACAELATECCTFRIRGAFPAAPLSIQSACSQIASKAGKEGS